MKKKFPELPDESFIYIQNSDHQLPRVLVKHIAFQIFYNDSISVCFEGVTKEAELPERCSGIYLLDYQNKELKFIRFIEGRFLKTFLKEHFFSDSSG